MARELLLGTEVYIIFIHLSFEGFSMSTPSGEWEAQEYFRRSLIGQTLLKGRNL
jgi:hypothetical protein